MGDNISNYNILHISWKQSETLKENNCACQQVSELNGNEKPFQVAQLALAAPEEDTFDLINRFVRVSTADEISKICDVGGLSVEAKNEAISEICNRNWGRCAAILSDEAKKKHRENTRELAGQRMIKSNHGTFLRAYDGEWKVDLMRGNPQAWEHWTIEDWGCKVVFKAIHFPGRYLLALPSGKVDLVPTNNNECPALLWKPFKNTDGSWSFLNTYGTWLRLNLFFYFSGHENGSVCCQWECNSWEKFTLPSL
ncbi:unnamed protein product [Caenorhabditis nigoni]